MVKGWLSTDAVLLKTTSEKKEGRENKKGRF